MVGEKVCFGFFSNARGSPRTKDSLKALLSTINLVTAHNLVEVHFLDNAYLHEPIRNDVQRILTKPWPQGTSDEKVACNLKITFCQVFSEGPRI